MHHGAMVGLPSDYYRKRKVVPISSAIWVFFLPLVRYSIWTLDPQSSDSDVSRRNLTVSQICLAVSTTSMTPSIGVVYLLTASRKVPFVCGRADHQMRWLRGSGGKKCVVVLPWTSRPLFKLPSQAVSKLIGSNKKLFVVIILLKASVF